MQVMQRLKLVLALSAGLVLGSATAALAANGGDSDADASAGFVKTVQQSTAVMIRVPVNDKGQENTDAAELRVYTGPDASTSSNLAAAFEAAKPANSQPSVSAADISKDSSTHGWYGWNRCGWQTNYYYYYQPTYYCGGSYYRYYQPTYYTYYTQPNYCGYRYYYYHRYW